MIINADSKVLKIARINDGISQRRLAALVDISENAISRIETGRQRPDYQLAKKIATVLNADIAEIFPYFKEEKGGDHAGLAVGFLKKDQQ